VAGQRSNKAGNFMANDTRRGTQSCRANDIEIWADFSVLFLNENDDQRQSFSDAFAENLSEPRIQLHCLIRGYLGAFLQFPHLIKRD
jgi:hypothetical protein